MIKTVQEFINESFQIEDQGAIEDVVNMPKWGFYQRYPLLASMKEVELLEDDGIFPTKRQYP